MSWTGFATLILPCLSENIKFASTMGNAWEHNRKVTMVDFSKFCIVCWDVWKQEKRPTHVVVSPAGNKDYMCKQHAKLHYGAIKIKELV